MRVLVACEFTGAVRRAFQAKGHEAWSCDIIAAEDDDTWHFECDVLEVLDYGWDLMIAHPPCTYLASSGLHWNSRVPGRAEKTEEALQFVQTLLDAPIERIALENPVGCISTRIRKADQYIQPYEFGEDASKKTGLWLKNLPLLKGTKYVEPNEFGRWANQTKSGQNKLSPGKNRAMDRSRTYPGIALAMAEQWNF